MRRITIESEDIQFCCVVAGDERGPLALCLHGYPDTPLTWRFLCRALAKAGWRVVAPYLRGFAPTKVLSTSVAGPVILGKDANRLHELLGADERAVLIGHDWGAAASYEASAQKPDRWSKIIAASWPPLPSNIDLASFAQMRRSWYVFLFQLEAADGLAQSQEFIRELWKSWSPNYKVGIELEAAVAALNGPRGARLVLDHYRALYDGHGGRLSRPHHPTLYMHGTNDGCIGSELIEGLEALLPPSSEVRTLPGLGHFPQLEAPALFNAAVLQFLGQAIGK